MKRLVFGAPLVLVVAGCGGKIARRPGESAESFACRSIQVGTSCSNEPACTFDAEPCEPDARMCVDGKWQTGVTMSCNPPPPR